MRGRSVSVVVFDPADATKDTDQEARLGGCPRTLRAEHPPTPTTNPARNLRMTRGQSRAARITDVPGITVDAVALNVDATAPTAVNGARGIDETHATPRRRRIGKLLLPLPFDNRPSIGT